jgi:urease beta subunit
MAVPGDRYLLRDEPIEINKGRATVMILVQNTGDRPIQIGSHFHFFEVNRALVFERALAFGKRLNILAGTAVRFEPGDSREVELVAFAGNQRAVGFNELVNGSTVTHNALYRARRTAVERGFSSEES